jgi:ABC-type nitrate/sulfonate/bicarbonate transport system ATPase subunit
MKVEGIRVVREETVVLDGVSFAAENGSVVSVLGPSGVGKTTLLRVIAGLDRPQRGVVKDDAGEPLAQRDVGIVFQDYPLLRHRTVEENLTVAARIAGLDRKHARVRVRELLERVGLEDRVHHYPAQLSGGQRQRAAIAQQLVRPRRVLLLDEPFSGLDMTAIASVQDLVRDVVHGHDRSVVVLVTHDLHAARGVSDKLVTLGMRQDRDGASVVSVEAA